MSGRKAYFEQLRDHLKTSVPRLKYVGRFNNQYVNENKEQPIAYPNILIRMAPENFTDPGGGRGIQMFDLRVTLFIGFANFKDQGEDVYEIIDEVYVATQLFVPTGDEWMPKGKLRRVDEREDNDHDQVQIHEMDFSVKIMDYSADIDRDKIQKTLTGDPSITVVETLTPQ